jgi:light-regulated signal transduction histidine kinase (bacteriophytochrome)
MDVQMPDLNGFETTNLIKSRLKCRYIPIIFITAVSTELKYVYRGYEAGAVDYISKPFNPEILRSKVGVFVDLYFKEKEILRQAELLNESVRREAALRRIEFEKELERRHLEEVKDQLEQLVNERTKELCEANRDLESFCYSIAHDLRTPIREVVATSGILLADCGDKLGEEDIKNLHRQSAAAKGIGRLIDDLLRLSRLGRKAIVRTPVDISALAQRVIEATAANGKFKIEVQQNLREECDAGLTEILIQNLADNAVKYSPNGGVIGFGVAEKDDGQAFYIKDQGIGFDTRYERKIFLPFERLVGEPDYPGTGVGLALVQKIVSKHGGKVWAESSEGGGSTFFFTMQDAATPEEVQDGKALGQPNGPSLA